MNQTRIRHGWIILYLLMAAVAGGALFTAGALGFSHNRTVTKTVHVEKNWGKPDVVVDGGQVNPQLAGATCDVYDARKTVVCHP
jgi:hypothetical protein